MSQRILRSRVISGPPGGPSNQGGKEPEEAPEAPSQKAEPDQKNPENLPAYLAIYPKNKIGFKHWLLYVKYDSPRGNQSFICRVAGTHRKYRYDVVPGACTWWDGNNRPIMDDARLIGMLSEANVEQFKDICSKVEIPKNPERWNPQLWFLDAIQALKAQQVVRVFDEYTDEKIFSYMDGEDEE